MRKQLKLTALALGLFAAGQAMAADLTVISFGGANKAAQVKAFYEPWKGGQGQDRRGEYNGEMAKVKAMVDTKSVSWDLVEVESPELARGCDEGMFEKLDPASSATRLTMYKAPSSLAAWASSYGPPSGLQRRQAEDRPTSWADFWDTKKFPGKRGLRKGAKYTLEFALMADGVAPKTSTRCWPPRRPGPRLQEARPAQAEHPVVGSRRTAAAVPGLRRRGHELGLQRPYRRCAERKAT
jgi:putative spermidine/putrescine transport system substrate-binding protein